MSGNADLLRLSHSAFLRFCRVFRQKYALSSNRRKYPGFPTYIFRTEKDKAREEIEFRADNKALQWTFSDLSEIAVRSVILRVQDPERGAKNARFWWDLTPNLCSAWGGGPFVFSVQCLFSRKDELRLSGSQQSQPCVWVLTENPQNFSRVLGVEMGATQQVKGFFKNGLYKNDVRKAFSLPPKKLRFFDRENHITAKYCVKVTNN